MNCNKIMNQLTDYLLRSFLDESKTETDIKEAIDHVVKCPQCIEELTAMSGLFTGKKSTLLQEWEELFTCDCEEFVSQLPEYVENKLHGIDMKSHNYLLWNHLQVCPDCQSEYKDLQDMFEINKELRTVQKESTIWEDIRGGIRSLSTELKIMVKNGAVYLNELPDILAQNLTSVSAVPVYRDISKDPEVPSKIVTQVLKIADDNKGVQITITIRMNSKGEIDLIVNLYDEKNAPLKKASVILSDSMNRVLMSISHDGEDGVEFNNLSAENFIVQIKHEGTTWMIKLNLLDIC